MKRIQSLDVLRGLALCGIIFANIAPILGLQFPDDGSIPPVYTAVELFVTGRFFPIFSFLFGISFALMWRGARSRSASPRIVLLRRVLLLGVVGALHQLLQPGEALLPYAIAALVFLLPATFLPKKWALPVLVPLGGAAVVFAAVSGGGLALVPGLFLLGYAAGLADMPGTLERSRTIVPAGLAIGLPVSVLGTWMQHQNTAIAGGSTLAAAVAAFAGLVVAATLSLLVVWAVQRSILPGVQRAIAALGRTSLTNYVGATLIITALKLLSGPLGFAPTQPRVWPLAMVAATLILVVQAGVSLWWLRTWRQGPLEAALRAFSWWEIVPLRRSRGADAAEATPSTLAPAP
ncbi:MAG TPA: DUF418 domain-containing protein [Dietzia timorensis]|uniref:DUF418 domain-containing protein n=1 Tax=Dietzia timorensis TaxID=499555 RepID=A0A921F3U2_9ACTN|nr:DUF418 domain-containing protein [Dietzia timorensis]HJE91156.1 DUF418 domain-containing protein [Dietzia timorensis]